MHRPEQKLPRQNKNYPGRTRTWAEVKFHKEKSNYTVILKHSCEWLKPEVNILMSVNVPMHNMGQRKYFSTMERKEAINLVDFQNILCILCAEEIIKYLHAQNS